MINFAWILRRVWIRGNFTVRIPLEMNFEDRKEFNRQAKKEKYSKLQKHYEQKCDLLWHIWKTLDLQCDSQPWEAVQNETGKIVKAKSISYLYMQINLDINLQARGFQYFDYTNSEKYILHHNHNTYISTHTHTHKFIKPKRKFCRITVFSSILFYSILSYHIKKLLVSII